MNDENSRETDILCQTVILNKAYMPGFQMLSIQVSRKDFKVTSELADKPEMFVQCESGGVRREGVDEGRRKSAALTDEQAVTVARLLVELEEALGTPQDFEWGIENGMYVYYVNV